MAKIVIDEILTFGGNFLHNATTWEIATDENFENIIDTSIEDKVNLLEWHSPLPKFKGDNLKPEDYYKDLNKLYARCKLHFGENNRISNWYKCKICNQNQQIYKITRNGEVVDFISTDKID